MFSGGFPGFGGFGGMGGMSEQQQPQEKKQVNTTEYYELLGVDKKATAQQIRKSFRRKALKEHPDKGGDPDKFKRITHAYQTLTNPEKRQLYDDYGQEGVQNGGPPGGAGGFGDIFSFFGGGGRQQNMGPRKAKPKLVEVEVTLAQVYNGCMKNVNIERYRNCETCDGKGGQNVQKCTKCKGRGMVQKLVQLGPGMYSQSSAKCPDCKGQGEICKQEDKCKTCNGDKIKKVKKVLEVSIEQGVPDYHDYIFTGESDEGPGIIAGDIYARVRISEHKTFQRRGADLVIVKKISLLEALTGVTMEIEHLDGKKYTIATAPGEVLINGELKTIKNLGLPFYKNSMSHGNLYIEFLVDFPPRASITPEKAAKLAKILSSMQPQKSSPSKKADKKILEEYDEADLNEDPSGGKVKEEQGHRGGGQQVRCESQ